MRYPLDWNDLRFFLAVARLGSLSRAARELRVDPGTVSRRIGAMELALGARCFERRPEGYPLTEQGAELLGYVERIENEIIALDRAVDASEGSIEGVVAVTAAETTASAFVVPALRGLRDRHPALRLELVSDNRVLSLSRREVDIALRMARSEEGELLSRRVGTMKFGLYASREYLATHPVSEHLEDLHSHAIIDWLEDYPRAPPAVWLREITARIPAVLKVNSGHDRVRAASLGLGVTVLPYILASETDLVPVLPDVDIPPLEIWLLVHPETARIPRVRAVVDYLAEAAVARAGEFTTPPLKASADARRHPLEAG